MKLKSSEQVNGLEEVWMVIQPGINPCRGMRGGLRGGGAHHCLQSSYCATRCFPCMLENYHQPSSFNVIPKHTHMSELLLSCKMFQARHDQKHLADHTVLFVAKPKCWFEVSHIMSDCCETIFWKKKASIPRNRREKSEAWNPWKKWLRIRIMNICSQISGLGCKLAFWISLAPVSLFFPPSY